jgi:mevalonate pyrophosphate decarboxylase
MAKTNNHPIAKGLALGAGLAAVAAAAAGTYFLYGSKNAKKIVNR